jgi:DNA-binding Lrp family transcriptional regulator
MTRVHQETARYKIKKRFKKLGFRFQAEVDYAKLGLQLHWGTFRFSQPYEGTGPKIFRVLNQVGYLTHFSKVLPQGYYVAIFALPRGGAEKYSAFLKQLQRQRILVEFSLDELVIERHKPMDPTFFNFRSGRWEVEWERVKTMKASPLVIEKTKPTEIDYHDLLIVKELQIDAVVHIAKIAKKLKVHPKTLDYHYRTHVLKRKLIPYYRIRWMQDITKTLAHSMAFTRLTFRRLEPAEYARVQGALSKIPFLWAEELLRDGTYIALINLPLTELIATNDFLNKQAPGLGSKVEIGYLNPSESSNFTVPYNMYEDGEWKFDAGKMKSAVLGTVPVIEK